jgi:hypothetical protein
MVITKSIKKKQRSQIISIWVYLKVKDKDGTYIPVCQHYSSKYGFRQSSLPRQMTCNKERITNEELASMTQDEIDNLPTQEEFIERMAN